jgi:hypothetical protein
MPYHVHRATDAVSAGGIGFLAGAIFGASALVLSVMGLADAGPADPPALFATRAAPADWRPIAPADEVVDWGELCSPTLRLIADAGGATQAAPAGRWSTAPTGPRGGATPGPIIAPLLPTLGASELPGRFRRDYRHGEAAASAKREPWPTHPLTVPGGGR